MLIGQLGPKQWHRWSFLRSERDKHLAFRHLRADLGCELRPQEIEARGLGYTEPLEGGEEGTLSDWSLVVLPGLDGQQ